MTLHTDKALKSKNFSGKKVYVLPKDIKKIISKPKKCWLEKGLFCFGHPN